jgi:hypothetical protein
VYTPHIKRERASTATAQDAHETDYNVSSKRIKREHDVSPLLDAQVEQEDLLDGADFGQDSCASDLASSCTLRASTRVIPRVQACSPYPEERSCNLFVCSGRMLMRNQSLEIPSTIFSCPKIRHAISSAQASTV